MMRTFIIVIALFCVSDVSPVSANSPTPDQIRVAIDNNLKATETVKTKIMPARCGQQTNPKLCETGYQMIISRLEAERTELEFMLAGMLIEGSEHNKVAKIMNVDIFNRMNRETIDLGSKLDEIFPVMKR